MGNIYFVVKQGKNLRTRIGQHRIEFKDGVFTTDNEALEKELAAMLDPESKMFRAGLASIIHILDIDAASKIAEANRLRDMSQRGTVAGGTTSAQKNIALANALKDREASILAQGGDPNVVAELMEKEHLALTHKEPGVSAPSAGFTADPPKPDPKDVSPEIAPNVTGPQASEKTAFSEVLKGKKV